MIEYFFPPHPFPLAIKYTHARRTAAVTRRDFTHVCPCRSRPTPAVRRGLDRYANFPQQVRAVACTRYDFALSHSPPAFRNLALQPRASGRRCPMPRDPRARPLPTLRDFPRGGQWKIGKGLNTSTNPHSTPVPQLQRGVLPYARVLHE